MNNEFSILGIIRSSNMHHTCIMFVLVFKKRGIEYGLDSMGDVRKAKGR